MMKTRTIILLAIVALLLIGSVSLAQSSGPPALAGYTVKQGTAAGGRYRLASTSWQVSGASSGGGYRLAGPASPAAMGCCCNYLPCVMRNYH
jgi:hypothetical protein